MKNRFYIILILSLILWTLTATAQNNTDYKKNFLGVYGGVAVPSGAYTKSPDYFTYGYQLAIGWRRSPNRMFSYKAYFRYISAPRDKGKVEDYYGFHSVPDYQSGRLNRYEIHGGPVLSIPYKSWSFDFRIDGAVVYAVYPQLQIAGAADTLLSVNIKSDEKITLGYSANFWVRHNFKGNFSYGFGLDYSAVKVTFDNVQKQFVGDSNNMISLSEDIVLHMNCLSILLNLGFRF